MSIPHLQQIHAACRPGANNHLDPDDDTQTFLDEALHSDVADGEVMSKEELLAALENEVDLENRPHPSEPSGDRP